MNVLQFSDYAAGRQGKHSAEPFAGILAECRDMLQDHLCAAMGAALDRVEEELAARRSREDGADGARLLGEALEQVRLMRGQLERPFRDKFERNFQRMAARSGGESDFYGSDSVGLELSLVDEDQVADEVMVRNLGGRLDTACSDELGELGPRVAHMLGRAAVDPEQDPLAPRAIVQVLKDITWPRGAARPVKLLLLDLLVRALAPDVAAAYRGLNGHLRARKVLPRLTHRVDRGRETGADGARGAAICDRLPAQATEVTGIDLATTIRRLFAPGENAGCASAPPRGFAPDSGAQEFIGLLTRLQRGEQIPSGERLALPAGDGVANVLHALIDSGVAKQAGSFDAILIDVVATLFDYIFNDSRVPEPMKGLIGRLQIPVLKLALLDRAFFSNRGHPARRLINTLAQAASDWEGPFTADASLYRVAEAIVLRIQNEFVDDAELFATCLRDLSAFLSDEEDRADARAVSVTRQLEQRERTEIARLVAQDAIAHYVEDASLPEAIRSFLAGPWKQVMVHAAVSGGEDGALWRCAAKTMDDLVWSTLPKQGTEERRRLVQRLPALLRGLRDGLGEVNVAPALRDSFFAELVKLHAAAVKSGMSPEAARSPSRSGLRAAPLQAGVAPHAGTCADAREPDRAQDETDALARGTWIDLRDASGAVHRLRLSWLSPARTMFLFTNRQGQRAMALTQAELSRRFTSGEAAIADDRPLIDRIVAEVLESLHGGI